VLTTGTARPEPASSVAAFAIGFVPPSQFGGSNPFQYFLIIGVGMIEATALVIATYCPANWVPSPGT